MYQPRVALKQVQLTVSIKLLHVSAPGCRSQGVYPPDTTHFTLHALDLDDISSDDQDRGRCLYAHCVRSANSYELVRGTANA
jgi:hypothetical protein